MAFFTINVSTNYEISKSVFKVYKNSQAHNSAIEF